jgi:hypothetical protein
VITSNWLTVDEVDADDTGVVVTVHVTVVVPVAAERLRGAQRETTQTIPTRREIIFFISDITMRRDEKCILGRSVSRSEIYASKITARLIPRERPLCRQYDLISIQQYEKIPTIAIIKLSKYIINKENDREFTSLCEKSHLENLEWEEEHLHLTTREILGCYILALSEYRYTDIISMWSDMSMSWGDISISRSYEWRLDISRREKYSNICICIIQSEWILVNESDDSRRALWI